MENLAAFDWLVIVVLAVLLLSKVIPWLRPKMGSKSGKDDTEKKMFDNKD